MHRMCKRRQLKLLLFLVGVALSNTLHSAHAGRDIHADHDLMPGWQGSDYQPPELPTSLPGRTHSMKVLNADARIFLFEGFLSPAECDQIVAASTPRLERSSVVAAAKSDAANTTKLEESNIRTSWGMFYAREENALIKTVEERMAAWTLLPVHNGEGLQVLRYENTQKYEPHWDYFFHKDGITNGGNRIATVLTYLSDVEEGGETIFPFIPAPETRDNTNYSECARKYLAVKPKKGDAILFHSMTPAGAFEKRSMHGSCPVIKGTKWSMAKWIHVGRFAVGREARVTIPQNPNTYNKPKPAGCVDEDTRCEAWSTHGECYKNEVWMVGTPEKPGHCLAACERCDIWTSHVAQINAHAAKGAAAVGAGTGLVGANSGGGLRLPVHAHSMIKEMPEVL